MLALADATCTNCPILGWNFLVLPLLPLKPSAWEKLSIELLFAVQAIS
jgi:hypothetical protein